MKNSLKYFGLWQKKRSELRIDDDPQTDWQQMLGLLDRHLPVEESGKPSRSKGFKLMSVLFVSMSAAAMTYIVSNVVEIKKHKHDHAFGYHNKHKITPGIDSISNDAISNSLTNATTIGNKDSLNAAKPPATPQSAAMANPAIAKNPAILSAKSATTTSLATAASRSNTSGVVYNKSSGAPVKKDKLTTTGGTSGGRRTLSNTNSKPLLAISKNNAPKPGGSHHNGGRYGGSQGFAGNNSSLLPGNSNRYANHTIINGTNKQDDGASKLIAKIDSANTRQYAVLLSLAPIPGANQHIDAIYPVPITASNFSIVQKPISAGKQRGDKASKADKPGKSPKTKNTAIKNSMPSNIDWGLLTGVNTSGSFTPKSQNSNFYGSSPVDLYFGLFGSYHLNDTWAINTQLRLFSPQTITTNYNHANGSKVDSGQLVQVVNSEKVYSVSVPIRAMYKVSNNISFVAGPVINFPVKQLNIKSSLLPAGIKADSNYYNKTIGLLNGTTYRQSLNLGITGGVNFQFNRLSFEASWLRSLSGYQVTSGYGSGRSYNNTFQFTIGFRLNKARP